MHTLTLTLIAMLLLGPTLDPVLERARAQEVTVIAGLDTVILTQINATFGSEKLPLGNGAAVEAGMYVVVSPQNLTIYDQPLTELQGGALPESPASRECKSGCSQLLWTGFRNAWLQLDEESAYFGVEVPGRVMIGAEASVPASTVVEVAYAAAETRPGALPTLSLLINGGNAGLRTRPFYLLPPGGLRVSPGDNVLALRVSLGANEGFSISAAHPRFAPEVNGTGWKQLAAELSKIKKAWPNKGVIIVDVGDASVGDVVNAMLAAQKHFDEFVLTAGTKVRWG